jgi:outer membrane protein OmpA-like peptidoglycan-associated protein
MTRLHSRCCGIANVMLALVFMLGLAGCATRQPESDVVLPFDRAIAVTTDALVQQTQKLSGLLNRGAKRTVVLDPTLDAGSGQQTIATQYLDRAALDRINRDVELEVLPFNKNHLATAQYLLTGTLTRAPQKAFRLSLALVDLKSGKVVAQSSALAAQDSVDMRPLPYYRDSPLLVRDEFVEGYVRTSSTPVGEKADSRYLERIAVATVINDATSHYNAARYREALAQYRKALAAPSGEQIRVLNGIYLSLVKLGQPAESEEAFGQLVAYGIAHNQLGVKFLFNPGGTDFWSDPKVTSAYRMWLRQIARQGAKEKVCLAIVGHTSKTGPEAANDSLSLRRAIYIQQRLSAESAEMAERTRPEGMGSRQNIVGSGSDDVVDAPDRRVEFKIVDCAR